MEGLGLFLVIGYLVVSFLGRALRESRGPRQDEAARERARAAARERAERLARAGGSPPARGADHGTSPTQVEARTLEDLLRGLSGVLEAPDEPEAPEEAYSLEGESIEGETRDAAPVRAERVTATADEGAESLVRRRIAVAEARSGALGPADHEAFHLRLARKEAAPAMERPGRRTEAARRTEAELRRAVVWREILGPPVSLRDGDPV